jgi:hypothetical protein
MSNVFCTGGDLRYLFKEYLVDTRVLTLYISPSAFLALRYKCLRTSFNCFAERASKLLLCFVSVRFARNKLAAFLLFCSVLTGTFNGTPTHFVRGRS